MWLSKRSRDDYEVTKLNYFKSNKKIKCNIKYPKISGMSDKHNQKQINNILKAEALKVLKYYEESYSFGILKFLELNIDYRIVLKSKNILSIQYAGVGWGSQAAHPNYLFYTTNIDAKKAKRLRLKDIVNIDEDFINKFLNEKFKVLRPEQAEAIGHLSSILTQEDFQKYFLEADSLDNIGTDKQSDVFSYLTKESLGISVGVGHALGDHVEFEIKYKDIKENINVEEGIWKDLLEEYTTT